MNKQFEGVSMTKDFLYRVALVLSQDHYKDTVNKWLNSERFKYSNKLRQIWKQ